MTQYEMTQPQITRRAKASLRSRAVTAAMNKATPRYLAKLTGDALSPQISAGFAKFDRMSARVPAVRGSRIESLSINGIGAEWVHGPGVPGGRPDARERVILYLHGGGWLFGNLGSHRRMISKISRTARLPVLALDYRMVPAVTFAEEIGDCVAGYRWLLERGVKPERIAIMGDSAGGHLTFATALRARDEGLPMPAALVGLSGVYDMSTESKKAHANHAADRTGALTALEWMMRVVLAGADPADGTVSPLRADLAGLPPTLLVVSSTEVVYCDSERMAQALAAAGVPCTLSVWPEQLHVFQSFGPVVPEAARSIAEIARFVRAAVRTA
ncbi:MAG TPA: alpha/beta hydrolase [Sporichthya sp.]|nr:alpha/beta hydrolase [Sporichthya sp.]